MYNMRCSVCFSVERLFKRRTSPFTILAVIITIILYGSLTYIYCSIIYTHVTPPLLDDRTAGAREKYDSRVNAVALYYYYY